MNDRRLRWGLAAGLFVVVLAAYIETMAGSASFWDCGEFIACAYTLGIPHPPATPLYVVLGRVFTLLPLPEMSIAQKVNFMSALFGALGVVMLFFIVVHVLRESRGEPKNWIDRLVIYGSALVAAFFTAWSNTYWSNAVEAEVYSIASFVMGLTTLLALRWSRDPESKDSTRNLYLIIYLLSLCVGFHLGTVLAYPAIAFFILLFRKKSVATWDVVIFSSGFLLFLFYVTAILRGSAATGATTLFLGLLLWRLLGGRRFVAIASLLFLLGITIHVFLLIRSAQNPAIDEADPQTFANLMAVLRRDQYPPSNPLIRKGSWEFQFVHHFWRYMTEQYQLLHPPAGGNLAYVPIVLGLVGLVAMAWRSRRHFVLLGGTLFITSVVMIIFLNFSDGTRGVQPEVRERDYFYSPAFYFFGMCIGIGLAAALDFFFGPRRKGQVASVLDRAGYVGGILLFLALTGMLYHRYHFEHDRTHERVPWGYGYNMLAGLEPHALIFTNGDNDTFPLWYQQEVEGFRKDVRVVNLSLLNTTWYPKQLRDNEPKVELGWTDSQIDDLRYEAARIYNRTGTEYQPRDLAVIQILKENFGKRPIYFAVTIPGEYMQSFEKNLVLEGLVFRFGTKKGEDQVDFTAMAHNMDDVYRFDGILTPEGKRDTTVYRDPNQETLVQNYANSFLRLGRRNEEQAARAADDSLRMYYLLKARSRYETAHEISPQHEAVTMLLAEACARTGESPRAESLYLGLLARDPDNDQVLFQLARLYMIEGHYAAAVEHLERLDQRNPGDAYLLQMLLEAYWGAGQEERAEELVQSWEKRSPGEGAQQLRDYFNRIKAESLPGSLLVPELTPPAEGP